MKETTGLMVGIFVGAAAVTLIALAKKNGNPTAAVPTPNSPLDLWTAANPQPVLDRGNPTTGYNSGAVRWWSGRR